MADNVARLLHQAGPDAKVVVWAHNGHVSKADGAMGGYLKRRFGDQAYLVGFEFAHGSFTSRTVTVHTFSVGPASPAYYAYALNRVGAPMLFLDFKSAMGSAELRSWLRKDLRSHDFAELYAVFPSLAAMGTPSTRAGWGRTTVSFSPGRAHLLSQWAAHPRRQAS